jgi:hypothetical protein
MLLERNQIGKREQLANVIAVVDQRNTPVQTMVPKGEAITNTLMEWQCDDFEDPNQDMAAEDGVDVETFSNASENRAVVSTRAMKIRDSAMVSDLADAVSEVAGLSDGEKAQSIRKKLKRLARARESFLCSDLDSQAGDAGVPYRGRGLGAWIQVAAQADLPVNANYRPPAASIDATPMATFFEGTLQAVQESIYTVTGEVSDMDLVCGSTLRRTISGLTTRVSAATNTFSQIRTYNTDFKGMLGTVVTQFDGDFGKINIHPSLFMAHPNFGGSAAAQLRRGYLLKMTNLSMHHKRMPRVKELEDRGGGPRFLVDEIVGWKVLNPKSLGKFNATT